MNEWRSPGRFGRRIRLFGAWQLLWLLTLGSIVGLPTFFAQRPLPAHELTFTVWFAGFLLGVELLSLRRTEPDLWRALRWIVFAGVLVVTFLAIQEAAEVIA